MSNQNLESLAPIEANEVVSAPVDPTVPEPVDAATTEPAQSGGGGIFGSFGSVAAFAIGYMVMKGVPPQVTVMILGGLAAGLAVGLIPFLVARARHQSTLAKWALGLCAASGTALGLLLAGPVAIVFTVISLMRGHSAASAVAHDDAATME